VFETRMMMMMMMMGERWERTEMFTEYHHPKKCRWKNDPENIPAD